MDRPRGDAWRCASRGGSHQRQRHQGSRQRSRRVPDREPVRGALSGWIAQAVLRSGLVVDVSGPGGEAVTTDMVTSVGGTGSAPSPGWLLRAAAASCVATLVALRAATLDVAVESLEVTVDSESDDRGILGIDPAVPAGPLSLRVAVHVHAPGAEADQLRGIVAWGVDHCPVIDAVRRAIQTKSTSRSESRLNSNPALGDRGHHQRRHRGTARARLRQPLQARQGRRHRGDRRLAPVLLRHRPHNS